MSEAPPDISAMCVVCSRHHFGNRARRFAWLRRLHAHEERPIGT